MQMLEPFFYADTIQYGVLVIFIFLSLSCLLYRTVAHESLGACGYNIKWGYRKRRINNAINKLDLKELHH
jgi:hypothetical protein